MLIRRDAFTEMILFFSGDRNKKADLNSTWFLTMVGVGVFLFFALSGCQLRKKNDWSTGTLDSVDIRSQFALSLPLSIDESLRAMKVEDGFEVALVAAEPLVVAPVALDFDNAGRIWVVEMTGYMRDTVGTGEDQPTGNIVILEDTDADGRVDTRKVFVDSLVLPRAISLVEDGVLIAEPPNLWFIENNSDEPGKWILVDGEYVQGGNAEHQANGLIYGLDNWIYSANSRKRYKRKNGKWLIDRTHFRGQWGITQDNYGRLFYNNNSANLLGDYFPAGMGAANPNQRKVAGFNEVIVKDKRVYPGRPTPGVNRAYRPGTLDATLRIKTVTAACGPVVYRGDLFGKEYDENVFVAEPAANLVKRNRVDATAYPVSGEQAYSGREFLTSTDERFRPVNLYNGPDGALYIVDMYRGIIEHKTYLTPYLKEEIERRSLTQPLAYGRIYKVTPANAKGRTVSIPDDQDRLVAMLQHPNGWVRDKAQQALVERGYVQVAPELRNLLNGQDHRTVVHALWSLEGLDLLHAADVLPLLKHPQWPVRMNALSALPSAMTKESYQTCLSALKQLLTENDELTAPLIAFNAQAVALFDRRAGDNLFRAILAQYPENEYVADAVISNLHNRESDFLKEVAAFDPDTNRIIHKQLRTVLLDIATAGDKERASVLAKKYPRGASLFKSSCQTCHGVDGNGMKSLAPPLNGSEWVTGDKEILASIVLFGLTGPITVNGKWYGPPDITADMPGIGSSQEISDQDVAELLSFIRASWRNQASEVSSDDIAVVRKRYKGRQSLFTMEELTIN